MANNVKKLLQAFMCSVNMIMPLFLRRVEEGRQYFYIKTNIFQTDPMPLKLHAQLSQNSSSIANVMQKYKPMKVKETSKKFEAN